MPARLLEGGPVADAVLADVAKRAARFAERARRPGLGTILVGDDAASAGYVRRKHETCEKVGIASFHEAVRGDATQQELLDAVQRMNEDERVDGFLIQHPVPGQFDFGEALSRMDPRKDADGLHPESLGRLVLQEPGPVPATPAGIKAMLEHFGIAIGGREVVVIGRGPTLGRPLALLLASKQSGANAAVTVVHSAVPDLEPFTRRADVLIAAVGRPGVVQPPMVKPGAVVVSGGITWRGRRLIPDVDESVGEVASWITPRLGGVGVTTVAMLLRNTLALAEATSTPSRT